MMPFPPRPEEQNDGFDEDQAPGAEPVLPTDQDTASPQPEAQVPPGAQGQANGGPLGCCLGVIIGLVLSLSVAILSRLYATPLFDALHGWLSFTVRAVMIVVGILAAAVFGYFGWRIGARIYREYELSPQQKQRLERLQQKQRKKQRARRKYI